MPSDAVRATAASTPPVRLPTTLESSTAPCTQSVTAPSPVADGRACVVARLRHAKSALREYAEAFAIALLLALLIRSFVVQAFKIPSGSMYPTLHVGDHILVNKLAYGVRLPLIGTWIVRFGVPHRGDVVVFVYPVDPSKDFIKRVVGVPGDAVEIRDKRIFVNGEAWDDPHGYFDDPTGHQTHTPRDNYGPVTVPPGMIFVMGDNRDRSYDSRFWGFVDLEDVKGKAFFIYWSWEGEDRWVRWDRIGDLIQ
jgi:signal peptidase I